MLKVLRDLNCPNGLDCPKIYGALADGRLPVRGDLPDAALLAELDLPDHEGVVLVPPALLPEIREVLTLAELGEFVARRHTRAAAGEQIRIAELTPALAQVSDFFVLDGEHVVRSRYDEDFRFVGAEVITDRDTAAPLLALAGSLWNEAADFTTWWAAHPDYHRDVRVA